MREYLRDSRAGVNTSISIAGEISAPLDIGMALVLATRDGEATHGTDDRGVGERRLGRDHGVRNIVVDCLFKIKKERMISVFVSSKFDTT